MASACQLQPAGGGGHHGTKKKKHEYSIQESTHRRVTFTSENGNQRSLESIRDLECGDAGGEEVEGDGYSYSLSNSPHQPREGGRAAWGGFEHSLGLRGQEIKKGSLRAAFLQFKRETVMRAAPWELPGVAPAPSASSELFVSDRFDRAGFEGRLALFFFFR